MQKSHTGQRMFNIYLKHRKKHLFLLLLVIISILPAKAQKIESGYITPSDFEDCNGNKLGEGGVQYISGSFSLPLSIKRVEQIKYRDTGTVNNSEDTKREVANDTIKSIKMWQLTLAGKYSELDNTGDAAPFYPDAIIDAGFMITHIRPLTYGWNFIATTGITLNADESYIRRQSINITAGIIFQYRINKNLHVGAGAVCTTAYGEPVIIPAPMVNWKRDGRYTIELNMHGKPELTISTLLNKDTKLTFTPFDMQRFSAMVNVDGNHKVFLQNIFKSSLGVSYRFAKHWSLEGKAAYIYRHTVRVQERSFKAFWKELFSSGNRMKYSNSCTFSVGLSYHFR
ncbi:MAG: hypothetical protein IJ436_01395 [Bacteroidaceae bacterium]|nr:hypothetical protein [Bacteroidaceae bacterium]